MKMIKELIITFKEILKLDTLKLLGFDLSLLKGFSIKVEFYEKKKD